MDTLWALDKNKGLGQLPNPLTLFGVPKGISLAYARDKFTPVYRSKRNVLSYPCKKGVVESLPPFFLASPTGFEPVLPT